MNDLIHNMKAEVALLIDNLDKFAAGNKAAGARARKATLNLAKLGKEFRARSVEAERTAKK